MTTAANCGTCLFWLPLPEQGPDQGLCRRYPPHVIQVGPINPQGGVPASSVFPPMSHVGWCGEHQTSPTPRHLQQ